MVVLPDAKPVDGVVPSRLEVAFELCEEENPSFLAAVDSHLETLPQAAKKILQNA